MSRVVLIVLDGVGCGSAPDAADFGDSGADTLGHILALEPQIRLPNLQALGFLPTGPGSLGSFGRLQELSAGKDTTTGHWEMMGILRDTPFPLYPDGFPADLIHEFERQTGRGVLGNVAASGTEIIDRLGEEQRRTGRFIVYTSADSVFQIAAHEDWIPLEELYEACQKARAILCGEHAVGRVIARPFKGHAGAFYRTQNRHDFSLEPPYPMLLDTLQENGIPVWGIGKIRDLFCGRGLARHLPSHSNAEGIDACVEALHEMEKGFLFANFVDFDMIYGHRRDVRGFAEALEETDRGLSRILPALRPGDSLLLTADHGCDPAYQGTDHTRELVPLTCYGKTFPAGYDFGLRKGLTTVGDTVAGLFGLTCPRPVQKG